MAGLGRLHHGLRTPVIPPEWGPAHQPVADGTRTDSRVSLRKPGAASQQWDEALEQMVETSRPPYAVNIPARVLTLTEGGRRVVAVEDPETEADVLVTLPIGTQPPAVGDLVDVVDCPHPALAGRRLIVVHTGGRSHPWELDVWCLNTD